MDAKDRLIFALDVPDLGKAAPFLDWLEGRIGSVKVNSLAVAFPEIVPIVQKSKIDVWRDFKHHDIPGTVANYIKADVESGLVMTTVHALGGTKMMEYAAEAKGKASLKILGITVLTSHDQDSLNTEIGIPGTIIASVTALAKRAELAGLDGVVASAQEAKMLRTTLSPETLIVTPGIKPKWAVKREDQARVTTPYQAILDGADYIVVGSAIRESEDPGEAADKIVAEIDEALSERTY